jgi:hypothetical protein
MSDRQHSTCCCAKSAEFFADATYRCPAILRAAVVAKSAAASEYFDSEMLECSEEDFGAGTDGYYRCHHCGAWWYLVFSEEEYRQPIFGVRSSEEQRRRVVLRGAEDLSVSQAKQQILKLLLGLSNNRCAATGCQLSALAGVALCPEHYSFPW